MARHSSCTARRAWPAAIVKWRPVSGDLLKRCATRRLAVCRMGDPARTRSVDVRRVDLSTHGLDTLGHGRSRYDSKHAMGLVVLDEVYVVAFSQELGHDFQLNTVDAGRPHEVASQQEGCVEHESGVRPARSSPLTESTIHHVVALRHWPRSRSRNAPPVSNCLLRSCTIAVKPAGFSGSRVLGPCPTGTVRRGFGRRRPDRRSNTSSRAPESISATIALALPRFGVRHAPCDEGSSQ